MIFQLWLDSPALSLRSLFLPDHLITPLTIVETVQMEVHSWRWKCCFASLWGKNNAPCRVQPDLTTSSIWKCACTLHKPFVGFLWPTELCCLPCHASWSPLTGPGPAWQVPLGGEEEDQSTYICWSPPSCKEPGSDLFNVTSSFLSLSLAAVVWEEANCAPLA